MRKNVERTRGIPTVELPAVPEGPVDRRPFPKLEEILRGAPALANLLRKEAKEARGKIRKAAKRKAAAERALVSFMDAVAGLSMSAAHQKAVEENSPYPDILFLRPERGVLSLHKTPTGTSLSVIAEPQERREIH